MNIYMVSFENDLSYLCYKYDEVECDNHYDVKKYFEYTIYKKHHNKQKVFALSLFNKNVDQQINEGLPLQDNINFDTKYKNNLFKLIPLINKTGYGINLFCEDRYKDLINDKNVNVYSFKHSYAAVGAFWRFLSVDFVEESIISDIDIDIHGIYHHKKLIKINSSCRFLNSNTNDFYVDPNKTAKKYSPILAGILKLLNKDFDFSMKDAIINFLNYQKNTKNLLNEKQSIYNKSIGLHLYGFGNSWLNYGSDERFLAKVIYFYLVKKGKLTTLYKNHNNIENIEDINYCLKYKNKIFSM